MRRRGYRPSGERLSWSLVGRAVHRGGRGEPEVHAGRPELGAAAREGRTRPRPTAGRRHLRVCGRFAGQLLGHERRAVLARRASAGSCGARDGRRSRAECRPDRQPGERPVEPARPGDVEQQRLARDDGRLHRGRRSRASGDASAGDRWPAADVHARRPEPLVGRRDERGRHRPAAGTVDARVGDTAQITVVVQPTAAGYITTRAAAKADRLDPYRGNNSRSLMVRVRPAA